MAAQNQDPTNVDTDLYSRQIYAMGLGAMQRMINSTIVFHGLGGPAVEIAKNVILSGVGKVILADDTPVQWEDLSVNCFVAEEDVKAGNSRSTATTEKIAALNPAVKVEAISSARMNAADLAGPTVNASLVVRCVSGISGVDVALNCALRQKGVKMIVVNTAGVFVELVNDFGDEFRVEDPGGEDPSKHYITAAKIAEKTEDDGATKRTIATLTMEREQDEEDTLYTNFDVSFLTATDTLSDNKAFPIINRDIENPKVVGESSKIIIEVDVTGAGTDVTKAFCAYDGGVYCASVVRPIIQKYKSLGEALKDSMPIFNFTFDDNVAHLLFRTLDEFVAANNALPKPYDMDGDVAKFVEIAKNLPNGKDLLCDVKNEAGKLVNLRWAKLFAATASANIGPFAAFVGGFVSQEVLKGVSGKFIPVEQIRYFDTRELIPFTVEGEGEEEKLIVPTDVEPLGNRYDGQVVFFGKANNTKIFNANLFVIGAGAIGCEYLKNLALMGISTGRAGKICVTDNDSIERSNLSRQFLFRNEHIGQFKSQVAAASVKKINTQMKIRALTDKVCDETSDPDTGIFNDRFWSQLSCICTAVDNNKARTFLDEQSGRYRRPMIDSGTLGPLGHVESIIPNERPRLRDGGGEADDGRRIPFCTLHFFPSNINHCIQYARDLFESLFAISAQDVNKMLSAADFEAFVNDIEPGARLGALQNLHSLLIADRPETVSDCIKWARDFYQGTFVNTIKDVLFSYPAAKKEDDGKPFWSGARKMPVVHEWNEQNQTHVDLLLVAARLRAETFNIDFSEVTAQDILAQVRDLMFEEYIPKKMVIDDKSKEKKAAEADNDEKVAAEEDAKAMKIQQEREEEVKRLSAALSHFHKLHNATSGSDPLKLLTPAVFEKDDATNGHIQFITCISNSRASTYGIPPEDEMFTKKVAGRIIPAMITTTAAVTGFASLQLYPILLGTPNNTVNHSVCLQDPSLSQTSEPLPPRQKPYLELKSNNSSDDAGSVKITSINDIPNIASLKEQFTMLENTFNSWDRFEISLQADTEINNVCSAFAKKYPGLEISSIVESRSSKWVYNAQLDKEQGEKFPLGMWTNNLLDKDTSKAEFVIDYVVKCTVVEPLREFFSVSESLPPLRYTVSKKRAARK